MTDGQGQDATQNQQQTASSPPPSKQGSNNNKRDTTTQPNSYTSPLAAVPPPASPYTYGVEEPPPVPGGATTPGKGVTVVNTQAMRTFSNNLNELVKPIQDSIAAVKLVDVRPGQLALSVSLANTIDGGKDSLKNGLVVTLTGILNILVDTVAKTKKLANDYDSADDLNALSANDYQKYLGGVSSEVGALLSSATPSGS